MNNAFNMTDNKNKIKSFLINKVFNLSMNLIGKRLLYEFTEVTKKSREVQLKLLKKIIEQNQYTKFGLNHNFKQINSYAKFKEHVPVRNYEELRPYIKDVLTGKSNILVKEKIDYFSTTSGSTGESKYIPITKKLIKNAHQSVARLFAYTIKQDCPTAYDGKILAIVSPAIEGKLSNGKFFGSTSGMLIKNMPKILQVKYAIPYPILEIQDYQSKYYCILLLSLNENITLLSTANPSTLILLATMANDYKEFLLEDIKTGTFPKWLKISNEVKDILHSRLKPDFKFYEEMKLKILTNKDNHLLPSHYWPNLSCISCWTGGSCNVYLDKLKLWFDAHIPIKDLGYLASEVRATVPLNLKSNSGTLAIKETFFEFLEVSDEIDNKKYLLCDQLEIGKKYYIFITDQSGLYRYNINDIVKVESYFFNTPNLIFMQKGKGVTNLTGEKIYEEQVILAMNAMKNKLSLKVNFYLVFANIAKNRYELYLELGATFDNQYILGKLKQEFDEELKKINIEYKSKRNSMRLNTLEVFLLSENSYEDFKKYQLEKGIREGQFKQNFLINDKNDLKGLKIIGNWYGNSSNQ